MRGWPHDRRGEAVARRNPVADAAARLDLREIEVFRLAHCWWFGRDPDTRALERAFAAYMYRQETPAWARHYARQVLECDFDSAEEALRLGLDRLGDPVPAPRHGRLIVTATAVVFALLFAGILDTTYDPQTSAPLAPESRSWICGGGGPGLVFLEEFAYAFADRERPPCWDLRRLRPVPRTALVRGSNAQ
jgi:hypothetical protein